MTITKVLDMTGLTHYNTKLNAKIAEEYVKKDGLKGLSENDFTTDLKTKLNGLTNYELPTAAAETKGGVKVGDGLEMEGETLKAKAPTWESISDKPTQFDPKTHNHTASQITDLQTFVDGRIAGSTHLSREIVDSIDGVEGPKENVVYMVKKETEGEKNAYDEYLYVEENFELIGNSEVDLSGYVKANDLQAISTSDIDGLFAVV